MIACADLIVLFYSAFHVELCDVWFLWDVLWSGELGLILKMLSY